MSIENGFTTTLKDADLGSLVVDISEVAVDGLLEDGFLKDLPIVGSLVSLYKAGASIQDRLFLKKIISFLACFNDVPSEKRKRMIEQIDSSGKFRIKVGEKLLYILDSCADHEIAERISRLFRYFIEEHITYEEFLMTEPVLRNLSNADFYDFISDKPFYLYNEPNDLLHTGLYDFQNEPVDVNVDDETDKKSLLEGANKYNVETQGGVFTSLSRKGEIILEIFSTGYLKKKEENVNKKVEIVES